MEKRIEEYRKDYLEKQKKMNIIAKVCQRGGDELIYWAIYSIMPFTFYFLWDKTQTIELLFILIVYLVWWISKLIFIVIKYGTMND